MAEPVMEGLSLRARRQLETRHLIEQVATELFESKGFKATTVEEISREAGIAARTFFRYFATKEEVLFGWLEGVSGFVDALELRGATPRGLLDNLEADLEAGLVEMVRSPMVRRAPYLRFRRLMTKDPELNLTLLLWTERMAANMQDRVLAHFGQRVDALTIRVLLEVAIAPIVVAVNAWADVGGTDEDEAIEHELVAFYRRARAERDALLR